MTPAPQVLEKSQSLKRPLVMGIINATPDSFYSQSRSFSPPIAANNAFRFLEEGADIIDLGGESTRPGSEPISLQEELDRVLPVLELLKNFPVPISIDTQKAEVAKQARLLGAAILNDISALRFDRGMIKEALHFKSVILMHRGGESPKTMQANPVYADAVREVYSFLEERKNFFIQSGGKAEQVLVDPGIGFGKALSHNLEIFSRLQEFSKVAPVIVGASRKGFIGKIRPDLGPEERMPGSIAVACWAALQKAAIVRVHDVSATVRALEVWRAFDQASRDIDRQKDALLDDISRRLEQKLEEKPLFTLRWRLL